MNDENKKLALGDPIDPSTLKNLEKLDDSWVELATRNAQLDQEKIQLLGLMKRVDTERARIFEQIQIERGISPLARIAIDPETLMVEVVAEEPKPEPEK